MIRYKSCCSAPVLLLIFVRFWRTPGEGILLCNMQPAVLLDSIVQQVGSQFCARRCSTVASLAVITAAVCQRSGREANASCDAACWSAHTLVAVLTLPEARFIRDGGVCNIRFPADR